MPVNRVFKLHLPADPGPATRSEDGVFVVHVVVASRILHILETLARPSYRRYRGSDHLQLEGYVLVSPSKAIWRPVSIPTMISPTVTNHTAPQYDRDEGFTAHASSAL